MSNTENKGNKKKKGFSRRKFLVRSGIGVGVIMGAGYLSRHAMRRYIFDLSESTVLPYSNSSPPNIWFEVTADNQLVLHSPKIEMGQGTFTGLAQIAAEELEVPVEKIKVVHAASSSGNMDTFATGGSTSISGLWNPLRELAATMREMLKAEAASLLGVSASALTLNDGVISSGDKSLTYGEIAAQVEEWEVPDTPPLKDRKSYKYVGQAVPRVDLDDKVMGAPMFGIDATMPDMLYGAVVRSSTIGAKYKSADTSAAEGMPGVVKIVKEPDFVGVVAKSYTEAENAKKAIKVSWETEREWQSSDIEEMIQVGKGTPIVIQKVGKAKSKLEEEGIIEAEYFSPIGAHAQLEPNGAVAFVEEDKRQS